MDRVFWRLLGVPLSRRERDALFITMLDGRTGAAAVDFVRADVMHNTEKSGALLAAQAIFVVVDIFALEHGWTRSIIAASAFLLLVCSLLAMSNLRPTLRMYSPEEGAYPVRGVFNVLLSRTIRFNVTLYLTFLSIALLILAAAVAIG
jgi:hypothetical protein